MQKNPPHTTVCGDFSVFRDSTLPGTGQVLYCPTHVECLTTQSGCLPSQQRVVVYRTAAADKFRAGARTQQDRLADVVNVQPHRHRDPPQVHTD